MDADKVGLGNKRRIWIAVMLSLIMPGLGEVYCGKLTRGLMLNFLNILPLPIIIWLFNISTASIVMPIVIVLICFGGMIQLIAMCDSAFLAKLAGVNYQLKDYNSLLVYVLFVLIVSGGSIGSALYLRDQTLEAFRVPTASCYPTILPGDRILANKNVYKSVDPERGDLVIFLNPENRNMNFIKRVVAVAGDSVEVKNNEVYINDEKLHRQKISKVNSDKIKIDIAGVPLEGEVFEETNGDAKYKIFLSESTIREIKTIPDFPKTVIQKHHCFVLGDNRNYSCDSRNFGPILLGTIKGRADFIYCPVKDWSRFGRMNN